MKIFVLENIESFLTFEDEEIFGRFRRKFIGMPMSREWESVYVEEIKPNGKKFDISKLCTNPVFSEKAVLMLKNMLNDKVEVLPYSNKKEHYYAINVINMIDCVDLEKSEVIWDYEYNIVKEIKRFVFIEEKVRNQVIFKIPQYKGTRVFVTDTFRDKVIETNLTGFKFYEVWDSEEIEEDLIDPEKIEFEGPAYSYAEARSLWEQGKTVASGKWAIQQQDDMMYLGELGRKGTYSWMVPYYIPPVLLDLQWHVIDRLEIPVSREGDK
jgi:hypothetical protein